MMNVLGFLRRHWGLVLFYAGVLALGTGAAFVTTAAFDNRLPREGVYGHTHKSSYRIGEEVTGQWRFMAIRNCTGHSIRWLTSSADRNFIYNLPSTDVVLPETAGPFPTYVTISFVPFVLPPMPVGIAYFHRKTTYTCNWLQKSFPYWFGNELAFPVIEFYVRDSGVNPPGAGGAPASTPEQ
jgi:hypothetical protein